LKSSMPRKPSPPANLGVHIVSQKIHAVFLFSFLLPH
jgi:hypothetical protein